jgi:hypothetical protein
MKRMRRVMMFSWMKCLSAVALLTMMGLAPAGAKDEALWNVEKKLHGKPKVETSEDVSGIACESGQKLPRLCLIVDDETQGAQIVLLGDGSLTAGEFIRLIDARYHGKPLELDAEGVAFADGNFYVVGSHGRARHETDQQEEEENIAKAAASRSIFRIALSASHVDMKTGKLLASPKITPSTKLAAILQRHANIKNFYDKPLENNGLTIEGIAAHNKRLYIGLRGPVLDTGAVVISVSASAVFDGSEVDSKPHLLDLDKDTRGNARGVRDLVRYGSGFLVLAGPVNDPENGKVEDGDYAIYLWNGADGASKPDRLVDLESRGKKIKPEAILPLQGDAERVRLLLMFDGPEKGSPIPLDVKLK